MHRNDQGFSHVLLFLFFVVILAAVGLAGWRVYQLQPAKQGNAANTTQTTASADQLQEAAEALAAHASPQAAKDFVAGIQKDLASQFVVDPYEDTRGGITPTADGKGHISMRTLTELEADGLQWYTPGYDFSAYSYKTPTEIEISVPDIGDQQKVDDIILHHFAAANMIPPELAVNVSILHQFKDPVRLYANASLVCAFESYETTGRLNNGRDAWLICDTASDFAAISVAAKPLADAYFASQPEQRYTVSFTLPKIVDSKTSGYKIAQFLDRYAAKGGKYVNAFDGTDGDGFDSQATHPVGVFYEKGSVWQFAVTYVSGLECDMSKYPSDVRLGFLGQECAYPTGPGIVR